MTHPSDGNTYAIEREFEAQEAHDDTQPVVLYCPPCDEHISSEDWPFHVSDGTCPNCMIQLEETP